MDYVFHVAVLVCIYATLALSLNLLVGYTGLLSLAHAAFYGLGAYSSALVSLQLGLPSWLSVVIGGATAGLLSLAISFPTATLHGEYLAIATFGFQYIVWHILNNWISVTRGPMGIPGIPPLSALGFSVATPGSFLLLAALMLALASWLSRRVVGSPFGRVLLAIREDEELVGILGKSPLSFKLKIFATAAAIAGAAGGAYAHYFTYLSPSSFTVMESILLLAMVIVGGAGSPFGPIAGAIILVLLPEVLRFVGLPTMSAASLRQVLYGIALVAIALYRPKGLFGRFGFGR